MTSLYQGIYRCGMVTGNRTLSSCILLLSIFGLWSATDDGGMSAEQFVDLSIKQVRQLVLPGYTNVVSPEKFSPILRQPLMRAVDEHMDPAAVRFVEVDDCNWQVLVVTGDEQQEAINLQVQVYVLDRLRLSLLRQHVPALSKEHVEGARESVEQEVEAVLAMISKKEQVVRHSIVLETIAKEWLAGVLEDVGNPLHGNAWRSPVEAGKRPIILAEVTAATEKILGVPQAVTMLDRAKQAAKEAKEGPEREEKQKRYEELARTLFYPAILHPLQASLHKATIDPSVDMSFLDAVKQRLSAANRAWQTWVTPRVQKATLDMFQQGKDDTSALVNPLDDYAPINSGRDPATVKTKNGSAPVSSSSLYAAWEEASRDGSCSYLPDVSYAGCHFGEKAILLPRMVFDADEHGVKPDDSSDDSVTLQKLIDMVGISGGGVVQLPAGTVQLDNVIRIRHSDVVIRGDRESGTIVKVTRSLEEMFGESMQWSYEGGIFWCGMYPPPNEPSPSSYSLGPVFARVAETASCGTQAITIDERHVDRVKWFRGKHVIMIVKADRSLLRDICAAKVFDEYPWELWHTACAKGGVIFRWGNTIAGMEGNVLKLHKPLRVALRKGWVTYLSLRSGDLTGIGIENLTIQMPPYEKRRHLRDAGWNGIFAAGVAHSWVRKVEIINADNGIILRAANNNTLVDISFAGEQQAHHCTSFSWDCHDNLLSHFAIRCPVHHGISVQDLSSGNVWRQGAMLHGTIDSHRGAPFDNVRTAITINNDGRTGGSGDSGPFQGRRQVLWNIKVTNDRPNAIFEPHLFPLGSLVGIQGCESKGPRAAGKRKPGHDAFMPLGELGCLVLDAGKVPEIEDIYEAQVRHRLGHRPFH